MVLPPYHCHASFRQPTHSLPARNCPTPKGVREKPLTTAPPSSADISYPLLTSTCHITTTSPLANVTHHAICPILLLTSCLHHPSFKLKIAAKLHFVNKRVKISFFPMFSVYRTPSVKETEIKCSKFRPPLTRKGYTDGLTTIQTTACSVPLKTQVPFPAISKQIGYQ